jgi:hypothetical protein
VGFHGENGPNAMHFVPTAVGGKRTMRKVAATRTAWV